MALDRFDSKKHSGVIDNFRKNYIKTGIFPHEYSKIIGRAFEVRLESDYEAFYVVSKTDVTAQVENAKTFLEAVEKYVEGRTKFIGGF
ncbi:MAG: HEPN domain-containing protein [Chitinispirillales bacterium]|nr:HEPN domain-containing protein [Chitinispirillales bacterium]